MRKLPYPLQTGTRPELPIGNILRRWTQGPPACSNPNHRGYTQPVYWRMSIHSTGCFHSILGQCGSLCCELEVSFSLWHKDQTGLGLEERPTWEMRLWEAPLLEQPIRCSSVLWMVLRHIKPTVSGTGSQGLGHITVCGSNTSKLTEPVRGKPRAPKQKQPKQTMTGVQPWQALGVLVFSMSTFLKKSSILFGHVGS